MLEAIKSLLVTLGCAQKENMPQVYIGIGSNLGDRKSYFEFAAEKLLADDRIRDLKRSPVYETEPVGGEGQPRYWNAVWSFTAELSAVALLELMHGIEAQAGRRRAVRNEARVLDLDILFYGDEVHKDAACIIPHPRLHERAFVLVPLCDLAPGFIHPVLNKNMRQLLKEYRALHGGIQGVERAVSGVLENIKGALQSHQRKAVSGKKS